MTFKTIHRDSCNNLLALMAESASDTTNTTSDPTLNDDDDGFMIGMDDDHEYSDDEDDPDTSQIIDINNLGDEGLGNEKTEADDSSDSPVETSVSSDEDTPKTSSNAMQVDETPTSIVGLPSDFSDEKSPSKTGLEKTQKGFFSMNFPWRKKKDDSKRSDTARSSSPKKDPTNDTTPSPNAENLGKSAALAAAGIKLDDVDMEDATKTELSAVSESSAPQSPNNPKRVKSSPAMSTFDPTPEKKRVRFATTARLISIYPHKSLPPYLKRQIWWQRADYKNFKKTIDIITQELIQHVRDDIWFLSAQDTRFIAPSAKSEENEYGQKWWCQYGHSRRGLEHICSTAEGKYRQHNVAMSVACILAEQERQAIENKFDSKKLSMAAFRYTSFARDLARAVGRSDQEAVQVNFDTSKLKGFRYYMPSKYTDGFRDWVRRESQTSSTLNPIDNVDFEDEQEECVSELDSFSENLIECQQP